MVSLGVQDTGLIHLKKFAMEMASSGGCGSGGQGGDCGTPGPRRTPQSSRATVRDFLVIYM